ncbi:hypothetical protein EB796_001700 [Bugula neritina]|uniref:Uncharacterized protein n=1 Tax=Bugula neritina TaxID=10212 RepID=A0A7J7KPL4_BUGNE|nr:hypothetical protein EB796_001700 [Bugula neritina]
MSKKQLHKTRNENSARYRTSRVLNRADDEMEANSDIQALNQFLHYLQEESDEDQTVEDGAEKLDDKPSSKRQFPIPTDISDDETDSEDLENGFTPIPPSSLHEEHQVISPQPSPFLKADEQGETITPLPLETSEADPEERTDSEPNSPHSDHGDQLALKDEDMQSLCRQCSELYLELGEKQTNSEHSDVEEADSGRGTASKDELESIAKSQIKVKVKRKQAKTKLPNGRHRIHYNLIDTPYASVPLKNIYLPKIKKKIKAIEQKKELVYCYMCGNYTSDTDHAYKAKLRYRQVSRPRDATAFPNTSPFGPRNVCHKTYSLYATRNTFLVENLVSVFKYTVILIITVRLHLGPTRQNL